MRTRTRRRIPSGSVNRDRWMVSYADFITLLFAFFLVMYSISSVNEGKYRVLSQTLTDAFQEPSRSLDPIQIGELSRQKGDIMGINPTSNLIEMENRLGVSDIDPETVGAMVKQGAKENSQGLEFIAGAMQKILEPYVEQELVEVKRMENRVIVDMKDKLLFPSGSARLSRSAVDVLRSVSSLLAQVPNPIQVEGNTDDRPIHNEEFTSNWELSAARAASVVHLMTRMGIEPSRMTAVGYAEFRPVADNASEEGRQKNRRVALVVLGLGAPPDQILQLPAKPQ